MKGLIDVFDRAAAPVRPAAGDWWNTDEARQKPVGELIAGLAEIGDLAIPYARLPRRTYTVFGRAFVGWRDLASQTPQGLLGRPKAGVSTVSALLSAAVDAVAALRAAATADPVGPWAATRRLLEELDDRDVALLAARRWAQKPIPQPALAQQLGVHVAWVQRNQPRAEQRFADLIGDPAHREVLIHAGQLRRRLGPYTSAAVVAAELDSCGVEPSSVEAQVLLALAGPYTPRSGWFEDTAIGGQAAVAAAISAVFDTAPASSTETLISALAEAGMPAAVAARYLETGAGLRRFDSWWVRWRPKSAACIAESVLHALSRPATAEDIVAIVADTGVGRRAVSEALSAHDRFVRATRRAWGLRAWGIREYRGIVEEIAALIDAAGAPMAVDDVIGDLQARFPDVAGASIRECLGSLMFVVEAGSARRRTPDDGWPPVAPLNTVRGVFGNGDTEIRLALRVSRDLLRGSSMPMHTAVAAALAVAPGQQRQFDNPHGAVTVSWRLASTSGADISSLRLVASAAHASLGDTLVLGFDVADNTVEVTRILLADNMDSRLSALLGRASDDPARVLAASLNCGPAEAAALLRRRGEPDLADLIER